MQWWGSNKHKSAALTRYAITSSFKVTFVWTKIQYDPRCNPDLSGHHYMESQTQNCTVPPSETHSRMSLTSVTFFVLTRVQTALWKMRLAYYQDLYCSLMDSWKPFKLFCKWHVGSRSNKVNHTPSTAPITSSQKYQRHRVSPAFASAKLVDGVTVWLNYPLLDQRPTCCENTEQGFQPFRICTQKTTLHSVLWLFLEDQWRHCATFQSSGSRKMMESSGSFLYASCRRGFI